MSSLKKNLFYRITEYEGFVREEVFTQNKPSIDGYQYLPYYTFDALEEFILANRYSGKTEAGELLSLSVRRSVGKTITARNYVGVITMKDGTVIEVLPKIFSEVSGVDKSERISRVKQIFLEMLQTLKTMPFKEFNYSNLETKHMNMLEIFISMFVTEANTLVKQGLKSTYNTIENNECFIKGKLDVMQNIKHNYANKERFYVRYDEFSINRPENRLIKATLHVLKQRSSEDRNKLNIIRLLALFESVEASIDYEADFSKCVSNRSMLHYEKVLSWCKVFLLGNSFTAFAGSKIAFALLFPMEKVFESFITAKIRRLIPNDCKLLTQDTQYSLFDHPVRAFPLRPDIVAKYEKATVIFDTKWKLLSENMKYYGISQSDMYQMYAYSIKYNADKIVLLYPLPESLRGKSISYNSDDGVRVDASFIDLFRTDESLLELISELTQSLQCPKYKVNTTI